MSIYEGLLEAAYALEEQAAGRVPVRERVLAGALALDTLRLREQLDRDLLDAAEGLKIVATGGTLELDAVGRERAGALARAVRALATHHAPPADGAPPQLSVECRARLYRAIWPRADARVAVFLLAHSPRDAELRMRRHLSWLADVPVADIVVEAVQSYVELLREGASDDVDLRVFELGGREGSVDGWVKHPLILTEDVSLVRKWALLQADLAGQHAHDIVKRVGRS